MIPRRCLRCEGVKGGQEKLTPISNVFPRTLFLHTGTTSAFEFVTCIPLSPCVVCLGGVSILHGRHFGELFRTPLSPESAALNV